MATKKKLLQAAAGVGGAGLNIEEVFSTYLYTGNDATRSITNGIDLSSEGGLVWIKNRSSTREHSLYDTQRGVAKLIKTNSTGVEQNNTTGLTAFNSDGFSLGTYVDINGSAYGDFASWTFRKAPKFFDVVTYTGTGSAQNISHNLDCDVGAIFVKRTDASFFWAVYHRNSSGTPQSSWLRLDSTNAASSSVYIWNNTAPTATQFTVGENDAVNASGGTYVAYLFAHNDGDGDFGPDADADIIKCGSYTGNGSSSGVEVDLGFEPQWVLIKSATQASTNWTITDTMRGWTAGNGQNYIYPHTNGAEVSTTTNLIDPLPNGFKVFGTGSNFNSSSQTYIYIAIRRGPMAVPESATDVFATETQGATTPNPPAFTSGFEVDAALFKQTNGVTNWHLAPRLTQNKYMFTDLSDAEQTNSAYDFDFNNGWYDSTSVLSYYRSWMWKRAPSFFDVVCYTGNGSAGHTVSHNLGVAPEMMWVKSRSGTGSWWVYHAGIASDAETDYIYLDYGFSAGDDATVWNDTAPTASNFTLGTSVGVNSNTQTYIAYLFASLAGISKVGSYTGNNTSQTIDCGFSAGARFVIIKRTDFSGSWYLWDSARGIVAGNDPYLLLDTNGAEDSNYDWIDPDNSGFIVNSTTVNASSGNYIFYAIA